MVRKLRTEKLAKKYAALVKILIEKNFASVILLLRAIIHLHESLVLVLTLKQMNRIG